MQVFDYGVEEYDLFTGIDVTFFIVTLILVVILSSFSWAQYARYYTKAVLRPENPQSNIFFL